MWKVTIRKWEWSKKLFYSTTYCCSAVINADCPIHVHASVSSLLMEETIEFWSSHLSNRCERAEPTNKWSSQEIGPAMKIQLINSVMANVKCLLTYLGKYGKIKPMSIFSIIVFIFIFICRKVIKDMVQCLKLVHLAISIVQSIFFYVKFKFLWHQIQLKKKIYGLWKWP